VSDQSKLSRHINELKSFLRSLIALLGPSVGLKKSTYVKMSINGLPFTRACEGALHYFIYTLSHTLLINYARNYKTCMYTISKLPIVNSLKTVRFQSP